MADEFNDLQGSFTFEQEKTIREKRANIWSQVQELHAAETFDQATAQRLHDGIDSLTAQLDSGLRLRKANAADSEIVEARKERTGKSADEHDALFREYLRMGAKMEPTKLQRLYDMTPAEMRVQNTMTGAAGGFLVPDGFWNRLVEAQLQYGPIEQFVNTITTNTGNDLPWLTNDDTTNEGELLNEGDTVSDQDLTFGVKMLRSFTYSSKMIRVSWQLLQDSAIDVEGLISRVAGRRLGRIHARHFTVGTGINQPEGITVGLSGGETLASGSTIDVNDLINIQHILDPAYRNGNQRWMFSDAVLKLVRKLLDGQNNLIWQPGLVSGQPDRLLGDPYVVNQSMPAPTTGNVSILYGDFSEGYIVRRVKGATAVRLEELYAASLQTGFFVYDRMDGKKDNTAAYTYGVQA